MAVMVLFRDRFRLVAPSSGTKFAHALIKYRLSQMSLHRIHHPPQKAMHDPRKAPLSSPRPKPIGALWLGFPLFPQLTCFPIASGWGSFLISQLFPQPACFPLASGWGILPVLRLFTQPTCFPLASGWGIFPVFQLFPQPACFPVASGWGIFLVSQLFAQFTCFSIAKTPGYKPGVSKHILVIIAIQLFHFLFTRVRIVQLQSYLCIITAYTIHDLEY